MHKKSAALVFVLVFTSGGRANEREAKAIVEKAIRAHGGVATLEKAAQCKRTDTGTQALLNRDVPFVSEVARSLPERVRLQIELDKRFGSVLVVDGNRGWQSEAGRPSIPLPPQRIKELREEMYVSWLSTIAPLSKPGFTLASLGRTKIDGESAVGIRVARRGYADAKMYFFERNGLLAKIERQVSEAGRLVNKEYLYGRYKEFGGATLPTQETIKVNGEKFTDITISNYSFPEKLGAGTFTRP